MKKIGIGIGKENKSTELNQQCYRNIPKTIRKRSLQIPSNNEPDEPVQILTFGDWKQLPFKGCLKNKNLETIEHKEQKQQSLQSSRLKQYQDMRMKKVHESERYRPKPLFPSNNTIIRKFCIDPQRKRQSIEQMDMSERNSIKSHRLRRVKPTKIETFKMLYRQQKEKYEAILAKYGIQQRMEDDEFEQFCG